MTYPSTLLKLKSHRPFPLPKRSWKYYQEWNNIFFLHYKVPQDILWELLPKNLLLDTFQGQAWLSVVGFTVRNARMKFLPPLPYLSDFHEINFRTYVLKDGVPGIFFSTIEAGKLISALAAREFIGLNYNSAKIKRKHNRCLLTKSEEGSFLNIKYLPLQNINEKTELDRWLTERYCVYEEINNHTYRFDIHHKSWQLKKVKLRKLALRYTKERIMLKRLKPDLTHYSIEQKVILWGREKC